MRKFTLIFCSLLMTALLQAQIIHVPADYPTIQLGIDAATPGDTVLVAEGTYYEQINFLGKKPLIVASLFLTDGDTMHISNTIIDGSLLTNPDNASVVYFISGEDTTSVLCGFTIRNGHGTRSPAGVVQGGGILILNSGATISNNRITGNRCEALFTSSNTGCFGGGIGANSGLSSDWVIIQDNRIDSNCVVSHKETGYCGGGGIAIGNSARIVNNSINCNIARRAVASTGLYAAGGAIFNTGSTNETLLITGNTITGNQALGNYSVGGAIDCSNVLLNLSHNRIINNHVGSTTTISNLGGGGLVADNCLTGSVIRNNLFKGNSSDGWSGALNFSVTNSTNPIVIIENNYFLENHAAASGGAIGINDCRLKLINNVFSHNEADYCGIGYIDRVTLIPDEHTAWLVNNTFSFNKTNNSFGGLDFLRTNPLIMNSIFWQNNAPVNPDITVSSGFAEIAYSNIDTTQIGGTCYKGPGIINTDPLYNDTTNLVPEHWSPIVDAGIGSYVCMHNTLTFAPIKDITGSWRPKNQLWDMGAYELGHLIHVPADFPKIQLGINAALPGDTVLVADDTYYEQINFLGKKPLMVASEFLMDGDTSHISNTIIDGSQLTNPDSASVVYFVSGEDTTSVLCGFSITHGKGTWFTDGGYTIRAGGGIYISGSGAKIIHNHITENHLNDSLPGSAQIVDGAGLFSAWDIENHWIVIDHNNIDYNSCYSQLEQSAGAGFGVWYNSRITNNTISNNICTGRGNASVFGGGFYCAGDITGQLLVTAIVHHNTIKNNLADSQHSFAVGGGGAFQTVEGILSDNEVDNNTSLAAPNYAGGAGIYFYGPEPGFAIRNNIFSENTSNTYAGGLYFNLENTVSGNMALVENNHFIDNVAIRGGAFATTDVPVKLQNNVFSGNHSDRGGAVYLRRVNNSNDFHLATLINNSFSRNTAGMGGAISSTNSKPLIINSVFWGDSADDGPEIFLFGSDMVEIASSIIDSSFITGTLINGGGILNTDPLFTDPVLLTTEPFSPCIDAGIATYTSTHGETFFAPDYDILGVPRPLELGYDMGAYEILGVGIRNYGPALALSVWPNPCTTSATFTYALAQPAQVLLRVFDNLGRPVATLVNGTQQLGDQTIEWNTKDLPAGVYYYHILAGNQVGSGKMVKR
ncbi:MAG: choice-of-anchor Q domain-containing protein [Lentimicrobium sp.]